MKERLKKERKKEKEGPAFLQSHCPVLLSRGLSREPCPKSPAPGGRFSIVKRWPLQAGPPAATVAASCPPPAAPTHTSHNPLQPPAPWQRSLRPGHRPVHSIKKDSQRSLRKASQEQHVFWTNINDDKLWTEVTVRDTVTCSLTPHPPEPEVHTESQKERSHAPVPLGWGLGLHDSSVRVKMQLLHKAVFQNPKPLESKMTTVYLQWKAAHLGIGCVQNHS